MDHHRSLVVMDTNSWPACLMNSSLVPLETHRVERRCVLNLSRLKVFPPHRILTHMIVVGLPPNHYGGYDPRLVIEWSGLNLPDVSSGKEARLSPEMESRLEWKAAHPFFSMQG
ncbi:hypothetical protein TNCV_3946611 [Trichonephila clavipes]|nr:hypothetical protein TNCV_3946611 [Trichonephila clavipes]